MDDRPCTQPWHAEARRLAALGHKHRHIGEMLGVGKTAVHMFLNPYAYAAYLRLQRERYAASAQVRADRNQRSRQWFQDNKALALERHRLQRKIRRARARLGDLTKPFTETCP